jgi:hypothetical protein
VEIARYHVIHRSSEARELALVVRTESLLARRPCSADILCGGGDDAPAKEKSHFAKTRSSQCQLAKSKSERRDVCQCHCEFMHGHKRRGFGRWVLLACWRARGPDGAEGAEPAVILADGEEAPSRLASRQDPPHLVQRLLPQTVRLHSHVVTGNDEPRCQIAIHVSIRASIVMLTQPAECLSTS